MKNTLISLGCLLWWVGLNSAVYAEASRTKPSPRANDAVVVLWVETTEREGSTVSELANLRSGQRLPEGLTLTVHPGERVALWTHEDELFSAQGPVELKLSDHRVVVLQGEGAIQRERFEGYVEGGHVLPEEISSEPLLLRAPDIQGELAIVAPLSIALRETSPRFHWYAADRVLAFDVLLEQCELASVGCQVKERWRNVRSRHFEPHTTLARGGRYRLTVHQERQDGPRPMVSRTFEVLTLSELSAIEGALLSLGETQDERPEVEVLRARLLESFGLWGEALALWYSLASRYPERDEPLRQVTRLFAQGASFGEYQFSRE